MCPQLITGPVQLGLDLALLDPVSLGDFHDGIHVQIPSKEYQTTFTRKGIQKSLQHMLDFFAFKGCILYIAR